MAPCSRLALVLLYAWTCLSLGLSAMLRTDTFPERRKVDFTHSVDQKSTSREEQDTMTEHMQLLYAKYARAGFPFRDGNTVRSFKAHWGTSPNVHAF